MTMTLRSKTLLGCIALLSACGQSGNKPAAVDTHDAATPPATIPTPPTASSAPADDCVKTIDAATAATILGVAKAREGVSLGHSKLPPNSMDLLQCTYAAANPDPFSAFLKYIIFTPAAGDVDTVYKSMTQAMSPKTFEPKVGTASIGWIRDGSAPGLFAAFVTFRSDKNIFQVSVGNIKGEEAAKAAAVKLAQSL